MTSVLAPAPTAPRRAGGGRLLFRGWRVFVPLVVLEAAVQGLLVLPDPIPGSGWGSALLVLASAVALLLAVWVGTGTAVAVAGPVPRRPLALTWRRPGVPVWTVVLGIVTVAADLLAPWLPPVVLVAAIFVLPAAALPARMATAATAAWRPFRAAPWRAGLAVVEGLVLAAVSWALALVLGVFVTGFLAAVLTWLWFGLVACYLLCVGASLLARSGG